MEFFDRCQRKEAINEEEKSAVMMEMYREGLIQCLGHTTLTKDELAEALAKEVGANILKIGRKDEGK